MPLKRLSNGPRSTTTAPAKYSHIFWVSYPIVNGWVYVFAVWHVSHTKASGASHTSYAGTTVTTYVKSNDTTSRLLSRSVAMVRVGAVRQRIEIARQKVSRYASLLESARIELAELQALQQEAVRQSRQHHQRQKYVWNVGNFIEN